MKLKLLILFLLLAVRSSAQDATSSQKQTSFKHFQSLEIGPGFNLNPNKLAILKVEFTSDLSPRFALSVDYRLGMDKSSIEFHQAALKLGPYFRLGKWSYGMMSTGFALFLSSSSFMSSDYNTHQSIPLVRELKQNRTLVSVPVQAKFSIPLYRQIGFGSELSHYFCLDKSVGSWSFFSIFISYQFQGN